MWKVNWLWVAAAIFLVPNSQALKSDNMNVATDAAGYFCTLDGSIRNVSIIYGDSPQGLPCKVTYQQQDRSAITLLEAKRNTNICETKAKNMALRLNDRGWRCEASAI